MLDGLKVKEAARPDGLKKCDPELTPVPSLFAIFFTTYRLGIN